jgi:NADPH-dependent 2,4-dienoyl-CoA reductase/sulfur reductase-like enzyme/rhodanese-related sulfurtransferase
MKHKRIVIIGAGFTGTKVATRVRRCSVEMDITLVEKGGYLGYKKPGMHHYVSGKVEEKSKLFSKEISGIRTLLGTRVDKINRRNKEVEATDLETTETLCIPYDKLVIAIGSPPQKPPIAGLTLGQVFFMHAGGDDHAIHETALLPETKCVTVIGAGITGSAVTEPLTQLGLEVTLVEAKEPLFEGVLDPEMAAIFSEHFCTSGVDVITGAHKIELRGNEEGNVKEVATDNRVIPADMVIVVTGLDPDVTLAENAGLKISSNGMIAVNKYLQTSDPDIYAGGDCVENTNLITRRKVPSYLASLATRHGRVIANNLLGQKDSFDDVCGSIGYTVFDYNIARTGLTEMEATAENYAVMTTLVAEPDRDIYYPGCELILIKLVADRKTHRLLGAQIVGRGDVVARIDTLATAITFGATVEHISNLDIVYTPSFSTPLDGIVHAANALRNKLDGLAKGISPLEMAERLNGEVDCVLLDLRSPQEQSKTSLNINKMIVPFISLDDLLERLEEIPDDKEVIVISDTGRKGYEAQRMLVNSGYDNVKFLEGGMQGWNSSMRQRGSPLPHLKMYTK